MCSGPAVSAVRPRVQAGDGASDGTGVAVVNINRLEHNHAERTMPRGRGGVQVEQGVCTSAFDGGYHSRGSEGAAGKTITAALKDFKLSSMNPGRLQCATATTLIAAAIAEERGLPSA